MTWAAIGTTLMGLGFIGNLLPLLYVPVLLLKLAGYSSFKVRHDRERVKGMLKILEEECISSSSTFEYGKLVPSGIFIGWKEFGYYGEGNKDGDSTEIVLYTSNSNFKRLIDKSLTPCDSLTLGNMTHINPSSSKARAAPIVIWNRFGTYTSTYYRPLKVDLSNITPIGGQKHVIDDVIDRYKQMNRLTVFVHGITGTGKSTLGMLVAKELNGSYCHDFNPTDPGDSYLSLRRDTEHEEGCTGPLVIVMEEIDSMIRNVHEGKIVRHPKITTSVHSKGTFNSLLDDMVFYRNVILILTSNESKEAIDKLDTSYLRAGRVHAYYSMMEPIVTA